MVLAVSPTLADPALEWTDTFDGGAAYVDDGTTALADPAGHLVIGGESYDGVTGSDMLVRKLHRDTKAPLWSTRYPAFDGSDMALTDMVWDGFGDILVGGYVRGCLG
jgi:hypothetical protein